MERKTGVVVPLSALYTKDSPAVGDFVSLKAFADFCAQCGLGVIQLLPVNDTGTQSSPYSALSAFALHPMYIHIESLPEFEDAMKNCRPFSAAYKAFVKECKYGARFDYAKVSEGKIKLLHLLYSYMEKVISSKKKSAQTPSDSSKSFADHYDYEIKTFVADNPWVVAYAVFKDLKDSFSQASWKEWTEDKRTMNRRQIELRWSNRALRSSHNFYVWCQMRAASQFKDASNYIRAQGIILKGDLPILMNEDSVDCWAWPEFFNQELRAGSPPDADNPLGQRWGFPTYNWDKIISDDFSWWKDRVRFASNYYSAFRLDHVLGFFRIWEYSEKETTAFLGHTNPYAYTERRVLQKMGFDDGRLHWLSQPHIPTEAVGSILGNWDEARSVMSKICVRIGDEELWNFKDEITCDSLIYATAFVDDEEKNRAIQNVLAEKWRDRTLIEIEKDRFVPVWSYSATTAWKSLSMEEKKSLEQEFAALQEQENELWKSHAFEILRPIVKKTEMQACAEDLGANLPALNEVLPALDIASLRVVRWTRRWDQMNQPYEAFDTYPHLSVTSTSVHDSSTIREWWQNEKQSVWAFLETVKSAEQKNELFAPDLDTLMEKKPDESLKKYPVNVDTCFDPKVAAFVLEKCAGTRSRWFINPLQDYLYLDASCYREKAGDERINVPGTVNENNWTYRMPVSVEDLASKSALIQEIRKIADLHLKCSLV